MTPTGAYDRAVSPSESSLHPEVQQLFAELDEVGTRPWMWVDHQADHVPDAVAISDSAETWTWRHLRQEVHRWSARVAVAAGPEAPAARPGELDAAWITYTSGSTGVPKGMTTTHGMLTQRAAEGRRSVIIPERPVVSGFQELSFMGVVKSVFGGLAAGADVRLFRPRLESVSAILSTIQQERLTFLHGPPQLMRPLWSICGPDDPRLATVRQVRLGADRTQPADLRAALRCLPGGCEVVIAYGSGELGSIAEVHYRRGDTIPAVRVPVGYPEAWVEVMVVDDDGAPVPRGETGAVELRSHGYTALPFPPGRLRAWSGRRCATATRRRFSTTVLSISSDAPMPGSRSTQSCRPTRPSTERCAS